jgi:hypothetical protein
MVRRPVISGTMAVRAMPSLRGRRIDLLVEPPRKLFRSSISPFNAPDSYAAMPDGRRS